MCPSARNFISLHLGSCTFKYGVNFYLQRAVGGYSDIILAWFSSHDKYSINPVLYSCSLKYPFLYSCGKSTLRLFTLGRQKRMWQGQKRQRKLHYQTQPLAAKPFSTQYLLPIFFAEQWFQPQCHLVCMLAGVIKEPYDRMKWPVISWRSCRGRSLSSVANDPLQEENVAISKTNHKCNFQGKGPCAAITGTRL